MIIKIKRSRYLPPFCKFFLQVFTITSANEFRQFHYGIRLAVHCRSDRRSTSAPRNRNLHCVLAVILPPARQHVVITTTTIGALVGAVPNDFFPIFRNVRVSKSSCQTVEEGGHERCVAIEQIPVPRCVSNPVCVRTQIRILNTSSTAAALVAAAGTCSIGKPKPYVVIQNPLVVDPPSLHYVMSSRCRNSVVLSCPRYIGQKLRDDINALFLDESNVFFVDLSSVIIRSEDVIVVGEIDERNVACEPFVILWRYQPRQEEFVRLDQGETWGQARCLPLQLPFPMPICYISIGS